MTGLTPKKDSSTKYITLTVILGIYLIEFISFNNRHDIAYIFPLYLVKAGSLSRYSRRTALPHHFCHLDSHKSHTSASAITLQPVCKHPVPERKAQKLGLLKEQPAFA